MDLSSPFQPGPVLNDLWAPAWVFLGRSSLSLVARKCGLRSCYGLTNITSLWAVSAAEEGQGRLRWLVASPRRTDGCENWDLDLLTFPHLVLACNRGILGRGSPLPEVRDRASGENEDVGVSSHGG